MNTQLEREIDAASASLSKLQKQLNDLDQEGLALSGLKPQLTKNTASGYAQKKNDIKLKIGICNQ